MMHISWDTSATRDDAAHVIAHYERTLGRTAERAEHSWKLFEERVDNGIREARVLEIIPSAHAAKFPGRDVPPAARIACNSVMPDWKVFWPG